MKYPTLGPIESDMEKMFAYVQYYFPKFKTPRVITLINEVDTEAKSFYVDTLALVSLDISGRPYLVCDMGELAPMIGDFDTELVEEFMRAFAFNAGITLHIKVMYGKNSHHKVEGVFKALGHALRQAVEFDQRALDKIPSTKGVLE